MNAAGKRDLARLIGAGDLLLVVPPFAAADRASLAAHLLQACARRAGFKVRVLYANLVLAAEIGWPRYRAICDRKVGPPNLLIGERLFSGCAHGLPFFDEGLWGSDGEPLLDQLRAVEETAWVWAEDVSHLIAGLDFSIVASTTTFEQTNASFALLHRVKLHRPDVLTLIGGANCDAVMADGIASLDPDRRCFDYIFSGESEQALPQFLQSYAARDLPEERIVQGTPCLDLDSLPVVDYTEYFEQRDCLIPTSEAEEPAVLPLESSRGCWWGQKHHCTFCGLNATGMAFREKSPEHVIRELRTLATSHTSRRVAMTDNIMPHSYFGSVVPQLAEEGLGLKIFYEQKANLSLSQVRALKKAGIVSIQPGIESLSDGLLDLMDKGVSAQQNLRLLRYARSAGVHLFWNLLWGFPGDRSEWYQQMAEFLPLLYHLQPPTGLSHLSIDRFSPYFERPEDYGVHDIEPLPAYRDVFPASTDVDRLAYLFTASYVSGSHSTREPIEALNRSVKEWHERWADGSTAAPVLRVRPVFSLIEGICSYLLFDTRDESRSEEVLPIDRSQAAASLTAQPYADTDAARWALEHKVAIVIDSRLVGLATAEPSILETFEARRAGAFPEKVGNPALLSEPLSL